MRSNDPRSYWRLVGGKGKDRREELDKLNETLFVEHFKNLSNIAEESFITPCQGIPTQAVNDTLNANITVDEILKCIKKLKNNKAFGLDGILNEFIKSSAPKLVVSLTLLFNLVLATGKVPLSWSVGCISPIYKGKGDRKDPDNYRGITVLSCLGKLFTSVLNDRIYAFLEECDLLGNEQAGFRHAHSTMDHVFTLHCLLDLYLQRRHRLFCAFVDYRKAFDSIQRSLLWEKLLKSGIDGKILNVIKDIYEKAKSCVKTKLGLSDFFLSNVGLRQGENLSPILFLLFLNDMKQFLSTHVHGIKVPFEMAKEFDMQELDMYLHLFILLYADDTVVLAESVEDMQKALDALKVYCDMWGLHINTDKTKVMIFSRGKVRKLPIFVFDKKQVEIVWDYKYLGVVFNYNNRFGKAQKSQCVTASRAMFSLLKRCRHEKLPIDIQLDLFEKCVHPVLLYGCEVWACENMEVICRMQLRFLKIVLGIKSTTPTCMVLGELGRFPIEIEAKIRMLAFWYKLVNDMEMGSNKLSSLLLKLCYEQLDRGSYKFQWLEYVRVQLENLGLPYFWHYRTCSLNQFKGIVRQRLQDQFLQSWYRQLEDNSVCWNYRLFKESFCFEEYLKILPVLLRQNLLRFRLANHKLPIQQKRSQSIPRDERLCTLCECGEIGDEFHYIFNCSSAVITNSRRLNLPRYFQHHPNVLKFKDVMNSKSKAKLVKLARFITCILREVR